MVNRREECGSIDRFYFLASKITVDSECSHEIKRHLLLGRKVMTDIDSVLRHRFADKGLYSQNSGFSVSHVWVWELDHKSWALKNWCFQTVVLEKTPESHVDSKEIKPVSPERNQHWTFIGRTDAEAEAPILWVPGVKSQLIVDSLEKTLMLDKIEGKRRGWQKMRCLAIITNPVNINLSKLWETVEDRGAWCVYSMVS